MSSKGDFTAAKTLIKNADALMRKHLHPPEWPRTFNRIDLLVRTLDHLLTNDTIDMPPNDDSPGP